MKTLLIVAGGLLACVLSWVVGYAMGVRDENEYSKLLDGIVDDEVVR